MCIRDRARTEGRSTTWYLRPHWTCRPWCRLREFVSWCPPPVSYTHLNQVSDEKVTVHYPAFRGVPDFQPGTRPTAVSYTHLDVYKRQGIDRRQMKELRELVWLREAYNPVSYTHLLTVCVTSFRDTMICTWSCSPGFLFPDFACPSFTSSSQFL